MVVKTATKIANSGKLYLRKLFIFNGQFNPPQFKITTTLLFLIKYHFSNIRSIRGLLLLVKGYAIWQGSLICVPY